MVSDRRSSSSAAKKVWMEQRLSRVRWRSDEFWMSTCAMPRHEPAAAGARIDSTILGPSALVVFGFPAGQIG
jgi:hypothetical protein